MSIIKIKTLASAIKNIKSHSKCGDNKKITITVSNNKFNKRNIINIIKSYIKFLDEKIDININDIKINSMNDKFTLNKRNNYLKSKNFIMSNIYSRTFYNKKFIVTFANFRDKIKFTELLNI